MAQYDVFISYRSTHFDWVEKLAENLQQQGYVVFLDRWALKPGSTVASDIEAALSQCKMAILLATPDCAESGWVQQELELMETRRNNEADFFYIPLLMGEFPALPFVTRYQPVDFADSQPAIYRQAFARLLCGLRQQSPGPAPVFTGPLNFPPPLTTSQFTGQRPLLVAEQDFVNTLFKKLDFGLPLMVLAQADTHSRVYTQAIKTRAEALYDKANVYHLYPPNSAEADKRAYFGHLARQCAFKGKSEGKSKGDEIITSWQLAAALAEKLEAGPEMFLLISGIENGAEASRREFAGELRSLLERFSRLRIVIIGGERLAALKYEDDELSILNMADDLLVPDLNLSDLTRLFGHCYPQLKSDPTQLQELVEVTGGQPKLLHYCLQAGAQNQTECQTLLAQSSLPAQLFSRFRRPADKLAVCHWLTQTALGRFHLWPEDPVLRKLYWSNLLTQQGNQLVWRGGFIRQTGREVLGC